MSKRDRAIAAVAIYMGVKLCLALFFLVPFMRFVTDSVGEGIGIRPV